MTAGARGAVHVDALAVRQARDVWVAAVAPILPNAKDALWPGMPFTTPPWAASASTAC